MWFILLACSAFAGVTIAAVCLKRVKCQLSEQSNSNDYSKKVKNLHLAKEMLELNKELSSLYYELVMIYMDDTPIMKNKKARVIMKIMDVTGDLEIATAVCALARIEAKKRKGNKDAC